MTDVILRVMGQNRIDHPALKPCLVYGCLYADSDKHLMVSATLEYIASVIATRRYRLIRIESDATREGFEVTQQ